MRIIGVYGSLKRGCYNHEPWGLDNYELIGTSTIRGAMDLFCASYPRLYPEGTYPDLETDHVLELYEIPDYLFSRIDVMERGAGYEPHEIYKERDNMSIPVTVWLMTPELPIKVENWITQYPPL